MRFFIVVLGLSTLAVAGPLPSFSNNNLKARAQSFTLANNTLDPDSIAALSNLKATYDSLNSQAPGLKANSSDSISASANITLGPDLIATLIEMKMIYNNLNKTEHNSTLIDKRGFWSWFKEQLHEDGLYARSSTVSNYTPSPEAIAAFTTLKAEYDSRNEKRMESDLTKRGLWHWMKMTFEAPGLGGRSVIPNSTPANITLDADSVAALTKLNTVNDSLNDKRTDSGVVVKRGFWYWLIHGTPNPPPSNASEQDDNLKEKRTESGIVVKRGLFSWLKKMYGTPPNVQISSRKD